MGVVEALLSFCLSYFQRFLAIDGRTRFSVGFGGWGRLPESDKERLSSCLGETKRRNRVKEEDLFPVADLRAEKSVVLGVMFIADAVGDVSANVTTDEGVEFEARVDGVDLEALYANKLGGREKVSRLRERATWCLRFSCRVFG